MGAVYDQLSITERRKIERWKHAKVPVDEMARVLKRCGSTIICKLKCNNFSDKVAFLIRERHCQFAR